MNFVCTKMIDTNGWILGVASDYFTFVFEFGFFWIWKWEHFSLPGISRHIIMFGPLGIEWARASKNP